MKSNFVPISLDDYVRLHLKSHPRADAADLRARLGRALEGYRSGLRCSCGEPVWVIGSAEAGLACFTCITGEADPTGDYEIDAACGATRIAENPG